MLKMFSYLGCMPILNTHLSIPYNINPTYLFKRDNLKKNQSAQNFAMVLYIPLNHFSVSLRHFPQELNQYLAMNYKCLTQGHTTPHLQWDLNTQPVGDESGTLLLEL